ncbi:MAG TPA: TonB-dependent receptor, partial [Stenotrophomonas sp.]|nr:TonB-dependent receptor [Stenotrophomonas sp.]
MPRSALYPLALMLPLYAVVPAAAQPAPSTSPPTTLDTVQVQAASYDARRDDTATRIVIGAQELRQYGDPALIDALKRLPGISVVPGAPGRAGTVSLRGLGNGYTQILINGQRAPLGFDLDALTPAMVERIEILRAPTADLRGEAIAGTLNIVLVAGARKDAASLTAAWGVSNGRSTPSLTWQRSRNGRDRSSTVSATASRRAFQVDERTTETGHDNAGGTTMLRDSRLQARGAREALSLAPSLDLRLGNGDSLTLQALADASRFHRAVDIDWNTLLGPPLQHDHYRQRTEIDVAQLGGSATWTHGLAAGGSFVGKLAVGGNRERYRYREQGYDTVGTQNLDDHTDARLRVHNINSTGKYALPAHGRHTVELGWEASVDGRDETRLQRLLP